MSVYLQYIFLHLYKYCFLWKESPCSCWINGFFVHLFVLSLHDEGNNVIQSNLSHQTCRATCNFIELVDIDSLFPQARQMAESTYKDTKTRTSLWHNYKTAAWITMHASNQDLEFNLGQRMDMLSRKSHPARIWTIMTLESLNQAILLLYLNQSLLWAPSALLLPHSQCYLHATNASTLFWVPFWKLDQDAEAMQQL